MEDIFMKKFMAILLILVMVFAMSSIAFATTDVTSPEGSNEDPDQPSPQTSDLANIVWVAVAAVLAIGLAVFFGKKLAVEK